MAVIKENKLNGSDLNSNGLDYCVRKNEKKFYGFQQIVLAACNFTVDDYTLEDLQIFPLKGNFKICSCFSCSFPATCSDNT